MFNKKHIKTVFTLAIFTMVVPFSFASFTISGSVDENSKNSKFSLKNISKYSHKSFSMSLLRTNMQNKGITSLNSTSTNSDFNSYIKIFDGNKTYVMPYKLKLKVPKFKTPSPTN